MSIIPDIADGPLIGKLHLLRENLEKVFFGKPEAVSQVLIGLLSRGHILIEDVPGVGKTVLARALARSLDLSFARLQLTPDMLPADILGVSIYNEKAGAFEFKPGPIFSNIILADEINRATPRTQSALLEAMNEAQVSIDGRTLPLERPFLVVATQNPVEYEGTYFLPEGQLDRFALRIHIGYPSRDVERRILREQPSGLALESLEPVMHRDDVVALQDRVAGVRFDDVLLNYVLEIVEATRTHEQLELGVSPRGALALMRATQAAALLAGRDFVIPDDIKALAPAVCAHRVMGKSYLRDGQVASPDQIITDILHHVPVPE